MKTLNAIFVILNALVFAVAGWVLFWLALDPQHAYELHAALQAVGHSLRWRWVVGVLGAASLTFSFVVVHVVFGRIQRQRTIAFENADGPVTVSLSAIEDFIRRLTLRLPEVKELKPEVLARKKQINVFLRATLWSDANIPQASERIQALVRGKVHTMLGIEEPVTVSLHIRKIVARDEKAVASPVAGPLYHGSVDFGGGR